MTPVQLNSQGTNANKHSKCKATNPLKYGQLNCRVTLAGLLSRVGLIGLSFTASRSISVAVVPSPSERFVDTGIVPFLFPQGHLQPDRPTVRIWVEPGANPGFNSRDRNMSNCNLSTSLVPTWIHHTSQIAD